MLRHYIAPHQPLLDGRFPLPLDQPFTHVQARQVGLSSDDLAILCGRGYVRRLVKSVYVATQVPDSLGLRAQALRLVVPPDAVVTDRTAGWLYGAEMILAPGDHLVVPPVSMYVNRRGGRLRNGLSESGQRFLRSDEVTEVEGLRVTTPLRTACDLGRMRRRDSAFATLTSMLRLGLFTRDELVEFIARFRRMRYVRQLRAFAQMVDPRAESFGEAVLCLRWWDTVNFAPELQIEVVRPGQWSLWLDLGVAELLFALEYYGEEWHLRTAEQRCDDEKRLGWLRQERGWQIEPVTRHNVFGPKRDIESIIVGGLYDARRRLGVR